MTTITVDMVKASRLRALRSRLDTLITLGDWDGASICADLILELIGLRSFALQGVA